MPIERKIFGLGNGVTKASRKQIVIMCEKVTVLVWRYVCLNVSVRVEVVERETRGGGW